MENMLKTKLKKKQLLSEEASKKIYDEEYKETLSHERNRFKNYEKHGRLNLAARRKLEDLVKQIHQLFVDNGITMYGSTKKPGSDIGYMQFKFKEDGSAEINTNHVLISSSTSCWMSLCLEKTDEEQVKFAKFCADLAVEMAEDKIKKEIEQREKEAKEKAEFEKRAKEQEAASKLAEDSMKAFKEEENKRKAIKENIINELEYYLSHHYDGKVAKFNLKSSCTDRQLEAIDKYVFQCARFSDAMNYGLSGLGLYSFNNDRTDAHENMLDAFGLSNDILAREITKDFDYVDNYDYKTMLYTHKDKEDSVRMLAFVLTKCKEILDKATKQQ